MNLRFLHIGDIHVDSDPKYKSKVESSLRQILNYCESTKVNAVVIPGDIWHKKQSYSGASGVPMFIDFLKKLSSLVDNIFITKGNHDDPGSIALLHQIKSNVYAYEYPVCLAVIYDVNDPLGCINILRQEPESPDDVAYIVSLMPYPTKSMFLSDDSIDNNNAEFLEKFEQIFELIGNTTDAYTCPKILGFHGNVQGSRLSSGQTLMSQDIIVSPRTMEKAKADSYLLNHIHLRQEIQMNMIYAGGIANFNWGEVEPKSFEVIEFNCADSGGLVATEYKTIPLASARPMVKLEASFNQDGIQIGPNPDRPVDLGNSEIRLRITVKEGDRKLITDNTIGAIKDTYGDDVKIEFNVIPNERESRSEAIMQCRSLVDEVKEYAAVIKEEVTESIAYKVLEVEGNPF